MQARARWFLRLAFAFVVGVTLWGSSLVADCSTYPNSRPVWDPIYGSYCGYTGAGCTQCVEGGSRCTTDGTSCEPFRQNW